MKESQLAASWEDLISILLSVCVCVFQRTRARLIFVGFVSYFRIRKWKLIECFDPKFSIQLRSKSRYYFFEIYTTLIFLTRKHQSNLHSQSKSFSSNLRSKQALSRESRCLTRSTWSQTPICLWYCEFSFSDSELTSWLTTWISFYYVLRSNLSATP